MEQIIGGIVTVAIGVITVAAIYQLGKKTNPIVPATTGLGTTTLNDIFKG